MQIENKEIKYLGFIFNSFNEHGCFYPTTSQVCKNHKIAITAKAEKVNKKNKRKKFNPTFRIYKNKNDRVQISIAKSLMHCGIKGCGKMTPHCYIEMRIINNYGKGIIK